MDSIFKASFAKTKISQSRERKASEVPPLVHICSKDEAYGQHFSMNVTQWSYKILPPIEPGFSGTVSDFGISLSFSRQQWKKNQATMGEGDI
ncbi:hypothetical protein GDO81_024997 [Engystomops pustulosus]|uniref:Uncharacterized protein n=1 Tax=Engystomops pustulosus TaxID=76066 RepID=A0AAV6YI66_ENGPU|nr:hypothetical protein GDO81_024997 [Engystomops pustulosus]